MISIYQIFHSEETRKMLEPAFIAFPNREQDEYFENTPIRKVYESLTKTIPINDHNKNDYIGITAPKFHKKCHMTGSQLISKIEEKQKAGNATDVFIYCPVQGVRPKWDLSGKEPRLHSSIEEIDIWSSHAIRTTQDAYAIDISLNRSGVIPFDLFEKGWVYSWNNFWVAKRHVFDDYCRNVLIPAMDWMEKQDFKKSYLHPSTQKFFTAICFTLEGLFGAFLANRKYSYDYICKRKFNGKHEWLSIDGYINKSLKANA